MKAKRVNGKSLTRFRARTDYKIVTFKLLTFSLQCVILNTSKKREVIKMITCDMILTAQQSILKDWGDAGRKVIEEAAKVIPFNGTIKLWLNHCTCCGGNWGGMLLTGLQALYPAVWEAIPDDMGLFAMADILNALILCGVDTSA